MCREPHLVSSLQHQPFTEPSAVSFISPSRLFGKTFTDRKNLAERIQMLSAATSCHGYTKNKIKPRTRPTSKLLLCSRLAIISHWLLPNKPFLATLPGKKNHSKSVSENSSHHHEQSHHIPLAPAGRRFHQGRRTTRPPHDKASSAAPSAGLTTTATGTGTVAPPATATATASAKGARARRRQRPS